MKLTIERSKWLRGEGSEYSKLLREEDGKMCCLGFFALACGGTELQIAEHNTPQESMEVPWPDGVFMNRDHFPDTKIHSVTISELMTTNDDEGIGEEDQEKRIAELFSKISVEVEFVD